MEQLVTLEEFPYIINKKINKSISYIHLAVDKRRPEIVKLLLRNGAMVNLLDNNNNTSVHYVSDIPTLKILIAHKARLDVVSKFDHTPIMTAAKEQRNNIFQYLRLYNLKQQEQQHPVVTVSKPTFHERFGRYYRERIREINEILIAKETLRPDDEELPELSCEMPPLEEVEKPTTYIFCGKPLASLVDPTKNATTQQETNTETTTHSSTVKDGMSRHDETTPILKVRQLKRLQGEKRMNLPPPLGCRFIHTEPMSVGGSEETDMEIEIASTRNLKFPKFGGEDPSDSENDNYIYMNCLLPLHPIDFIHPCNKIKFYFKSVPEKKRNAQTGSTMPSRRTVLNKTFALTSQQHEGTVALLDVRVEVRKIPARVTRREGQVEYATSTRYHQDHVICDVLLELEGNRVQNNTHAEREELNEEIADQSSYEDEEADQNENPSREPTSEDSDATEVNEDLPYYSPENRPPPYFRSTQRDLPSPTAPGSSQMEDTHATPLVFRREEDYQRHRQKLIRKCNRACMNLYYKYEFQARNCGAQEDNIIKLTFVLTT
jgi:hypothetical protein